MNLSYLMILQFEYLDCNVNTGVATSITTVIKVYMMMIELCTVWHLVVTIECDEVRIFKILGWAVMLP
jgi:hypothetical protein